MRAAACSLFVVSECGPEQGQPFYRDIAFLCTLSAGEALSLWRCHPLPDRQELPQPGLASRPERRRGHPGARSPPGAYSHARRSIMDEKHRKLPQIKDCLDFLRKICENVRDHPRDPKFRRVWLWLLAGKRRSRPCA